MPNSAVSYLFDADTAFVQAGTGQTLTASGNLTARVALDKMVNARADSSLDDALGAEGYAVVIAISAVDVADGDEAYTFTVQGTDASGGNAVAVGSLVMAAGEATTGQWVIKVPAATIKALGGNVSDVELNVALTAAGTTPSVTIAAAWLAHDRHD